LRHGRQLDALGHRAGAAPGRLGRARALPRDLGARERRRGRRRPSAPAPGGDGGGAARGAARHRGLGRAGGGARMRAWGAALVLALLACGPPAAVAAAQDGDRAPATDAADVADAPPPGTGDAWIDVRLDDMDRYAARYREAFVDEIARYLEAPRPVLVEALERGMRPGDLYYAC